MKFVRIFILVMIELTNVTVFSEQGDATTKSSDIQDCHDLPDKDTIVISWNAIEPYQYVQIVAGRISVTGMDIELLKAVVKKIKLNIGYQEGSWIENKKSIENGTADVITGATYTDERAQYAYFSVPYRSEDISLFTTEYFAKKIKLQNIEEFLVQVCLLSFRLGILRGVVYGNMEITNFLNSVKNNDIITKYDNTAEALDGFTKQEIDGFLSDRIVGTAAVLGSADVQKIKEVTLNLSTPIHLMFSKKTVPEDLVAQFNYAIQEFLNTDEYKKIVKTYIYHTLLPKSFDVHSYYIIGLIGSIAFAFSGIAIGLRTNSTLYLTFALAILPSIINCLFLDLITNHYSSNLLFNLTPIYIYTICSIVLISFAIIKLFDYYNKQVYEDVFLDKICTNTVVICDALGQSVFIVVGVIMVLVMQVEPLNFWGMFFAFITSNCGVIFRDLINGKTAINHVPKSVSITISILWALILSTLLNLQTYNPHYDAI